MGKKNYSMVLLLFARTYLLTSWPMLLGPPSFTNFYYILYYCYRNLNLECFCFPQKFASTTSIERTKRCNGNHWIIKSFMNMLSETWIDEAKKWKMKKTKRVGALNWFNGNTNRTINWMNLNLLIINWKYIALDFIETMNRIKVVEINFKWNQYDINFMFYVLLCVCLSP